jgi:hypothetical protein
MRWTRAGLALLIALASAGCTGPEPVRALPRWESCGQAYPWSGPHTPAADLGADVLPRLDADFIAVGAAVCGAQTQERSNGSRYEVATEKRTAEVADLVAALRLPDIPRRQGLCEQDNPSVPWFVLLDAQGRWVRPGVPQDDCGKHRPEVRTAVDDLTLTRVSSWPIGEVLSAQAAAAGCRQGFGNSVQAHARVGGWAKTVRRLVERGALLRLCVYRVPAGRQRATEPSGDFLYGGMLPAGRSAAVDAAVHRAGRGNAACAKPVSRFAVLIAEGEEAVFAELDGCRRVSVGTVNAAPSLQQATPALLAILNEPNAR